MRYGKKQYYGWLYTSKKYMSTSYWSLAQGVRIEAIFFYYMSELKNV